MTTPSLPAAARGRAAPRRRLATLAVAALAAGVLPMLATPTPASSAPGQPANPWTRLADGSAAARSAGPTDIQVGRFTGYALDRASLAAALDRAPEERGGTAPAQSLVVSLPAPDGTFQRFALVDSPVMAPGLAARHPEIRTYAGRGLDDPTATVRADLTPLGFHASVRSERGVWYVDPYSRQDQARYASYYVKDATNPDEPFVEREDVAHGAEALADELGAAPGAAGGDVTLRTYRLALVTDPSYASYFGQANVTAAKVTLVNRVTQIYSDETAIRLVLVDETEKTNLNTPAEATGANGPCGAAPCYTAAQISSCGSGTLSRNNIVLGQLVGASNYDVGHIGLGVNGGGIAGLGVVGGANKARGCTGLPTPVGDFFAVDYVAHEIGHQFAGNHTFNGTQWNCSGGNRSPANSYEPGSGSSIMAYAGICQQDNLQPHSDPYWSQRSYTEITTYVGSARPAVNEVQNVSLREFDTDGDSFTLRFGDAESVPIVRDGNYSTAGIKAAIEAIPGWPAGALVAVAPFGGTGLLDDTGFQVTFAGGPVAAVNVGALAVTNPTGTSGFVGETVKGGPIDNGGWRVEQTGNSAPVVTAPAAYTIPVRTPFALTGSATDADGDTVTYLWEQNDRGGVSGGSTAGTALVSNTKTNGPLFRQFGTAAVVSPTDTLEYHSPGLNAVTTDPTRVFPDLAQIAANNTNAKTGTCPAAPPPPTSGGASNVPPEIVDCYSEFLPTADWVGFTGDRTLHFRLTARDGHPGAGGIGSADTALTLAPAAGPFLVTSQATADTLVGGTDLPVSWDVAGTDAAPIGVSEVKISLSVDGGRTFGYVLAERTANDGAETVTLPNVGTKAARIRIEAVGNVFFDLNDADFALRATPKVTLSGPGEVVTVQYSDPILPEVRVTVTDPDGGPGQLTATATGLPAGLLLGAKTPEEPDGSGEPAVWGVVGNNRAAPGDYPVTVTVTDQHGLTGTVSFTVRVLPESAELAYTGDTLVSGSGRNAEVLLQATLREISPDTGAEPWPGDVSTATVTFTAGGRTLCTDVPAPLGTGDSASVASCTASLPTGGHEVTVTLGGNYAGSTKARVEVARSGTRVVLGGGSVTPTRSAGAYPVDPKSRVELSVLVAQTRLGGTGTTAVSFRSEGRRYEIRGVGLDSFGVRSSGGTDRLDLRTRAGLYDVTDSRRPVTVATGLTLRITGTDRDLLGGRDSVGVTLTEGDRLLLSSDWTGLATQEINLTSGTLLLL
ncbi:M12 family metallo-peptidase [Plantactinospora sp. KLBMP9567]|uniref:M12 family metallo-peptidase n=1 Tax=Plantactinospora sp. KLBMP9567 TaxID=3085900 RepID=UPI002980FE42|nr:M12 family metallo-peptidase [Plantactinospora sp. KLBMP9567]MDW5323551.1 M12 family metallo-peptidase [Plantactinospora sp. KLBMP9567]